LILGGNEILTTVVKKSSILMSYSLFIKSADILEEHVASIFWKALLATCFHTGFLLILFFDPEDGGNMFLQNVG
jgi:hypothetical protein